MTILASDVIAVARVTLNDPDEDRWADTVLLEYVKDAQDTALRHRPDLRLDGTGALSTPSAIAATSSALFIPDRYKEALAKYVAGRALSEDNADEENREKGGDFITQCLMMLVSGQA